MSYGIWDVGRKKWMPDPLLGHMSRRPESFKTRGEAERTADREWRKLNPDVKFEVRPLPSTEESRRTRKPSAHAAGADYAREQLAGSYFQDWVWEQMAEAERMRQADPNSVIDASTPAGARKVAKNMLQQLKWDTKRALKESKEFFEGFDEVLQSQSSIDWLADMILDFDKEAREKTAPEAREARTETMTPEQRDTIVAALHHYGGGLSSDGFITHGEKVLSVRPEVKKGRLRMVAPDGNVLATYPVSKLASGVADFVERFWYWKPVGAETREAILDFDKEAREGAAPGKETREAKRGRSAPSSGPQWVPPALARDGITPVMLEVLLHGMGEHSRRIRAGNSVVYDRAYTSLKEMGYVVMKRATPGLSSFGDYFVLTDKGADVLNRYRVEVRKLAGKTEARESRRPTRRPVAPYYSRKR